MKIFKIILLLSLLIPSNSYAALSFGNATSDRVNYGSATALDNMDPFTYAAWIYPRALVSGRAIMGKAFSVANYLRINGTGGNLDCVRGRGSGGAQNSNYVTNNTPIVTLNKWYFVACTFASGSAQPMHIYVGDLTTPLVEATYGTAQVGTGTLRNDAADLFAIGNAEGNTTATGAFPGNIASAIVINRELSIGELKSLQYRMRPVRSTLIYSELGFAGTGTQADWSGNKLNGTVTGATTTRHVPLKPFFGF